MSIFRNTFFPTIKSQLNLRQNSIRRENRPVDVTTYLNSRNAWIRMSSSVNVRGSNDSAKKYVLQGGTLYNNNSRADVNRDFTLKSDIGRDFSNTYSTENNSGEKYRLGIRPMPGIVSMDVKSKAAYGSLREVVVSFQCWDIKQLEELELLYMRPGYTVLVEWGWSPYIMPDTNGNPVLIANPPQFYDILNKGETERTIIFKELYDKCISSGGNYDAMYGYIKNYSWSARADGGYDCTTTVISTGEIIESLKINYVRPDLKDYGFYNSNPSTLGFLKEFTNPLDPSRKDFVRTAYEKNTMAGMWAELYMQLYSMNPIVTPNYVDFKLNNVFVSSRSAFKMSSTSVFNSDKQYYITLDCVLAFIERYIIPRGSKGEPLLKLSVKSNTYESDGSDLLCVAHPLQVSIDPSVCVIKSPVWYNKSTSPVAAAIGPATDIDNEARKIAIKLRDIYFTYSFKGSYKSTVKQPLEDAIDLITNSSITNKTDLYLRIEYYLGIKEYILNPAKFLADYDATSGNPSSINPSNINTEKIINDVLKSDDSDDIRRAENIQNSLASSGIGSTVASLFIYPAPSLPGTIPIVNQTILKVFISPPPIIKIPTPSSSTTTLSSPNTLKQALDVLEELRNIPLEYFYEFNPYSELGIIKNIYVSLEFLYKKAIDTNLESSDSKEKNEINLYRYLKSVITEIQAAIGNVSNFEIHVDPVDSVARIIDLNYADPKKSTSLYDDLFQLEVQNLKAVVRSYTLQSQIFPDQSAIIAIGSQAKGGQLGIQNNTMIDFNREITDRITPKKEFPIQDTLHSGNTSVIATSLAGIVSLFGAIGTPYDPDAKIDITTLSNTAKNNLRDLIVYFQSTVDSSGANRNLIPVKFSFEMDGIGGLVIGHLFKVNEDVLPRGYKGGRVGSKLAQTIVRIGHTIQNNDWVTKIDALNIILDDKKGKFKDIDISSVVAEALKNINTIPTVSTSTSSGGPGYSFSFPFSTGPCPDITNRPPSGGWDITRYPLVPFVPTPIPLADIISFLKGKIGSWDKQVIRSTYASIILESGYGKSGINNNINGMQSDGRLWPLADTFVSGTTVLRENVMGKPVGRCRSFCTYSDWRMCIEHVLAIMNQRVEGSGKLEIVPKATNPNQADFWAKGYAQNWIGGGDPTTLTTYWNKAVTEFP